MQSLSCHSNGHATMCQVVGVKLIGWIRRPEIESSGELQIAEVLSLYSERVCVQDGQF